MRILESDSDSDDNIPIAKIRAKAEANQKIKAEPINSTTDVKKSTSIKRKSPSSDSDDDNIPLAKIRSKTETKQKASKTTVKVEPKIKTEKIIKRENPPSDSDDDIPISALSARTSKRNKVEAKTTPQQKASPRPQKKKRIKIKFKQQECTEELYGTLKGRLVQELLCRWWYVIEWPQSANLSTSTHGMQELDGFRGTYIRVKGDDMGSIVDTRPQIGKPSFMHFMAMPSTELQKLLLKAYEKQMEVLIQHEGPQAPLLKELKSALSSASKISTEKADHSVRKILKKYKELADKIDELEAKVLQGDNTGTEEEAEDEEDDESDDEM